MLMKAQNASADNLTGQGDGQERGYAMWKRAKVGRGLEQAQNRSSLIPMEQILREFGIER